MAAALVFAAPAGAVDPKWKDRGDRFEGIRAENVSGGDFELLGVYAEPGERAGEAETLWVSVPLRQAAELRLQVWEPKSGYAMVPKQRSFAPGESFSWSRSGVLAPRGIASDALNVLATDLQDERLYYPARITTAEPSDRVTRYRFRFRSRGGVDLVVTVKRKEEGGRLVDVEKGRREEEYPGVFDFTWDGRGEAGVYQLRLEGTLFLRRDQGLEVDVTFVHYGDTGP